MGTGTRAVMCGAAVLSTRAVHLALLGANFKVWPMPKLGLSDIASVSSVLFTFSFVFFSKGPVLLSMNFKEFSSKPAHSSSLGTASG